MPTERPTQPPGSPIPGVIPEPVVPVHGPPAARTDPGAERDARREQRAERRGPPPRHPGPIEFKRRKPSSREAPRVRLATAAAIVALTVGLAALMSAHGSAGWLIGLVASLLSLVLAAVFLPSRHR